MAAVLSTAIPSFSCAAADLPDWAAKFAATVSVAHETCSEHYKIRLKEAAKLLAGIRPRVDPDDPRVNVEREEHAKRLKSYFADKSREDTCSRLYEVLGPSSRIVKDHKIKPVMTIRLNERDQ